MVLDELASVDKGQIPSVLERLASQGFNLFAAATYSASPELIYLVGRHLEIDRMHTAQPYDSERTRVFWGGAEGFPPSAQVSEWVDQTQDSLL